MNETHLSKEAHDEPGVYEIRIKGHLDDRWATLFDGLSLTREGSGDTLLTGPVVDQAALFGLLRKVRDMGVPLISVTLIGTGLIGADGPERSLPLTDP
jgi:hypothetical protein